MVCKSLGIVASWKQNGRHAGGIWHGLHWGSLVLVTILLLVGSFVLIMNNHRIIGTVFGAGGFLVFLGSLVDQVNALSGKDDISTDKNDEDN